MGTGVTVGVGLKVGSTVGTGMVVGIGVSTGVGTGVAVGVGVGTGVATGVGEVKEKIASAKLGDTVFIIMFSDGRYNIALAAFW